MKRFLSCLAFLAAGLAARADLMVPVSTELTSNITIKVSSPVTSVPHFGFMPVRIDIENLSAHDGAWRFRFDSRSPTPFPGLASSTYEFKVASAQSSEFWVYVPLPGEGLYLPAAAAGRSSGAPGAVGPTPSPLGVTPFNVLDEAQRKLQQAGLGPKPGMGGGASARSVPGSSDVVVTITQSGPANVLGPVDARTLPAGFTNVVMGTTPSGMTTREFTYVGKLPTPSSTAGTFALTALTNPSTAEAESEKLLKAAGLVVKRSGIQQKTTLTTFNVLFPMAGGRLNILRAAAATVEQTGPAAEIRQLPPGSPPPGVAISMHPAPGGALTRVIAVVEPALSEALINAAVGGMSGGPEQVARLELMKLGYLRTIPGVTQSNLSRATSSTPVINVFTETGPTDLLPSVSARLLPAGITSAVRPGALAGEVARDFIVDTSVFGGALAGKATTSASAWKFTPSARSTSPSAQPQTPLMIEISGPGISKDAPRVAFPNGVASPLPPLAVPLDLEAAVRTRMLSAGVRTLLNLAPLDPAQLPADWRIWSSFNGLLMKAADFAALDAGRRSAIRGWIAMGGRLVLVPAKEAPGSTEALGAGHIVTLSAPVETMAAQELVDALELDKLTLALPNRDTLLFGRVDSPMAKIVDFVAPNITWIALFLLGFAVLIGPVNLYFFAPAGKRHRMFVTTPIISVGGAIAVGAAIFLQDGLGGEGIRRSVVVLMPAENQAAVWQEQATHTGFLMGSDFKLDDAVLMAPLPGVDMSAHLAPRAGRVRDGAVASGAWFRNRSRQSQMLRALVPTRARVERVASGAGGAPVVESTLATELQDFRLRDDQGRYWTADSVPPGRRVTLVPETAAKDIANIGTFHFGETLQAVAPQAPWQWIARGGAIDIAPLKTLGAIRWQTDDVVYAGTAEPPAIASRVPSAAVVQKGSP